jgi:hypothetical protein
VYAEAGKREDWEAVVVLLRSTTEEFERTRVRRMDGLTTLDHMAEQMKGRR